MPELPEVQTIINGLNKKIRGLTITDVWADWPGAFKRSPGGFGKFKKVVKGKKILKIWRIGKNIIFDLSDGEKMLIHLKMTGHLLVGTWNMRRGAWVAVEKGAMTEKVNSYIHAMFSLSGDKMMAFSDMRKFGKILAVDNRHFANLKDLRHIGPDPLNSVFRFNEFVGLMRKKRGAIKKILMDQSIVSGIGNIYSDEILFMAKVHPLKKTEKLNGKELGAIFGAIRKILHKAVKLRGTSTYDYRDTAGQSGNYGKVILVYQRDGEQCPNKCGNEIKRLKIGSRSAHFCPHCQPLN